MIRSTILWVAPILAALTASAAEAQTAIPVNVESTPAGAMVYLDAPTGPPIGMTPLRNVRIPRGPHTLIFRMDNHEEGRLPVNVSRRRETFRIVLSPLATITVTAGNDAANSGAVRIDGNPVGNIPYRGTVQPGRHLVQVGRDGYRTFNQWVDLSGGQVLALPVMLEREAPESGSVLVAGDSSGAPVFIDGEPRGVTPTVIENVPVGEHVVEIRPDGREPHRQTIFVRAGERTSVNPRTTSSSGSLRVITNVPGATVSVDGEAIGNSPATAERLAVGQHIVEATADGYRTAQETVTIEAGQQRVVSLRLEPGAAGRIVVRSSAPNAVVSIDGETRGTPPVVVESPAAGVHTIVVSAEGYEDFRHTCETGPGRGCDVEARLRPMGTPVRVEVPEGIRDAELWVDGERIGPIPYEGTLPVGSHRMEVRAEGYEAHVEQIRLTGSSEARVFNIPLSREGSMSEEERAEQAAERMREATGAVSHAAAALPEELAVLDFSVGWIFPAEIRLGVGILPWLEGGFAFRTIYFARYNEFELRAKLGFRPVDMVSGGLQVRFGGGIGPTGGMTESGDPTPTEAEYCRMNPDDCVEEPSHAINSFFFSAEALGTLHFAEQAAFSLWLGVDIHTDQYDWLGTDDDLLVRSDLCSNPTFAPEQTCAAGAPGLPSNDAITNHIRNGRQNSVRLRLGGNLELVLSRHWNLWVLIEGILAGPSRDLLGDVYGFGLEDTEFYARLGLTHKF